MSIFQTFAKTVMVFEADTKALEQGLKKVQGAEKDALKATLETTKARNEGIDKWAERLANANQIMELANKAIQIGAEAWKEYEANAKKVGGAQLDRAKEFRGALDQMNEAWRQGKILIGEFVVSMAPALRSLADAAALLGKIGADIQANGLGGDTATLWGSGTWSAERWREGASWLTNNETGLDVSARAQQIRGDMDAIAARKHNAWRKGIAGATGITDTYRGGGNWDWTAQGPQLGPQYDYAAAHSKSSGGGGGYELFDHGGGYGHAITHPDVLRVDDGFAPMYEPNTKPLNIGGDFSVYAAKAAKIGADLVSEHKKSVLESVFGPIEEFDAYAAKMQVLGDAVGAFSGALQEGFDAWVSGSKTLKEAIEGIGKSVVTSLATQMFAHALAEGALAIGSLVGGDFKGAAGHGIAAAKFGVTGVAIGALARGLNGGQGGGGASAGAGSGAYTGSGGGGGGGGTSVQNIYIGDGMGQASPRFERQRAKRSYALARRESSDSTVVRWG